MMQAGAKTRERNLAGVVAKTVQRLAAAATQVSSLEAQVTRLREELAAAEARNLCVEACRAAAEQQVLDAERLVRAADMKLDRWTQADVKPDRWTRVGMRQLGAARSDAVERTWLERRVVQVELSPL